jgi:glycosyltransferase involved in cell wall biosynthesis
MRRYSMAKICWLSDLDSMGSGYQGISVNLCERLSRLGHEVKVIGWNYKREEHYYSFTLIPATTFPDIVAIILNLANKWDFDIMVVALDIPHHEKFLQMLSEQLPQRRFAYIGIMAVEAGPLTSSWAYVLMAMQKAFVISGYGTQQAINAGVVHAEHIQIGIDAEQWRIPEPEERKKLRDALGVEDDEFLVLSVGDNQERKNPHKLMQIFAEFSKGKKTKLLHVTREWNPAGARLKDYAAEVGIIKDYMLFERGMPFKQLWGLYAISDAFLLPSKAEGLGLPLLEAMAVGVPVIATNCTAISEVLADGRGLLADYEYQHRDCFGNGWRYWTNNQHAAELLNKVYKEGFDVTPARKYVEELNWDIPTLQLNGIVRSLTGK